MTMRPTEGKWFYDPENIGADWVHVFSDNENGTQVASVRFQANDNEQESNARVIAAAPQMLSMLEKLTEHADADEHTMGIQAEAKALIKAIHGEEVVLV